jgi:hypothetical protein
MANLFLFATMCPFFPGKMVLLSALSPSFGVDHFPFLPHFSDSSHFVIVVVVIVASLTSQSSPRLRWP